MSGATPPSGPDPRSVAGPDPRRTTAKRARAFFEAQHKRFSESQRLAAYQSSAEIKALDADDFSPEEAKKLLWEGEEMRQPVVGYRITEKLGQGGMATIFRAKETASGQEFAIKLLYPGLGDDEEATKRFVREGMALIKLDHRHVLAGHDFGFSKGFYFLVLELADGESLQAILDRGKRFREREAVEIARQTARAVEYLDGQGIVHRDIKPANLLLLQKKRIKLCDFGLSLDRGAPRPEEPTGKTCGTVEYMSPEQARGEELDVRSDLYSLGATLYHLVARRPPFLGDSPREVMHQQVHAPLDFTVSPALASAPLQRLLGRLLAKRREDRYPSVRELLDEIRALYRQRTRELRPDSADS